MYGSRDIHASREAMEGGPGATSSHLACSVFAHPTFCATLVKFACAVQAGVGIFFQQEADGSVYVKTVVSGGSAEREGGVRVGDMILAVDDREVRSCVACSCPCSA